MRPLSKHLDIVSDHRIINNDIIEFAETQINLSDSTCKIITTLNFLDTNFYNNQNKFLSLVYVCRNDVAVLDKFVLMKYQSLVLSYIFSENSKHFFSTVVRQKYSILN